MTIAIKLVFIANFIQTNYRLLPSYVFSTSDNILVLNERTLLRDTKRDMITKS